MPLEQLLLARFSTIIRPTNSRSAQAVMGSCGGLELLEDREKAQEPAVKPAAEKEIDCPIRARVKPGRVNAVGGGAHLGVVVVVGENRELGLAGAAAALEETAPRVAVLDLERRRILLLAP